MTLTKLQIKDLLDENRAHDCEGFGKDHMCVRIASIAELPTRFGKFQVVAFWNNRGGKEHAAFVELTALGVKINDRIPLIIPPNLYNEFYLRTKARKSEHMMEFGEDIRFMEQHDQPIIDGMNPEQIAALHQIDSLRAPHPQAEG